MTEKNYDIVKTDIYTDRGGVNQAFLGIGAYEPIQFNAIVAAPYRDALNEWVAGAGNWYFQPKRAGLYLITLQWRPDAGAALEFYAYARIADVIGTLFQETITRTYRAVGPVPLPERVKLVTLNRFTPTNQIQLHAALSVAGNIDGNIQNTWVMITRVK